LFFQDQLPLFLGLFLFLVCSWSCLRFDVRFDAAVVIIVCCRGLFLLFLVPLTLPSLAALPLMP